MNKTSVTLRDGTGYMGYLVRMSETNAAVNSDLSQEVLHQLHCVVTLTSSAVCRSLTRRTEENETIPAS